MRITYFLRGLGYTGGSMVLYGFMDKLVERGYEVYAVMPDGRIKWDHSYSRQVVQRLGVETAGAELARLAKNTIKRSATLEALTRAVLRKPSRDPVEGLKQLTAKLIDNWIASDITIATFCTTAYASFMLMDKTLPLYHMQHYEELFFENEIEQKIARLTYFLPLELIANSKWLQGQIMTRAGRSSHLLNPGIDTNLFKPYQDVNRKYDTSLKQRTIILSYYSPVKFKAWNDALAAMKAVFSAVGSDAVEWIVFGGIPQETDGLPIKAVGKVFGESLARLYSQAHIVFMNSWYESFPLPPLEAMACGAAVVTTRIGTEDYAYDGENCLVVPPRKPEQLAQAIVRLIEDRSFARQLAINGIDTAGQFSWDKAADRLEGIISCVVGSRGNRFCDVTSLARGLFC